MEKISSILPSNSRVTSVDLDDALPARPGAPAMGRKSGRNSVNDRVTLSEKAKEIAAQDTMMAKNPKEVSRAKMVDEINRKFFETRLQKPAVETPKSQEVAEREVEAAEMPAKLQQEDLLSRYESKPEVQPRISIEA